MRELKFRAWDKEDKKYYPLINLWFDSPLGKLCTAELWLSPKATEIADIPEQIELEQYTGLKDKNGKEVYEGDILKFEDSVFEIGWLGKGARFGFCPIKKCNIGMEFSLSHSEVIGNIHENAELLG